MVDEALAAAQQVAERVMGQAATLGGPAGAPSAQMLRTTACPSAVEMFAGADVALVDDVGQLDLFGQTLRAVAADGTVVIPAARPDQWDDLVAEADPGSSAPHPYLVALGPDAGTYRVGPVAQLRVGPVPTPIAARLQQAWQTGDGSAASARAIIVVHAVEMINQLLGDPDLVAGPVAVPCPADPPAGIGVGWVDGARGLLVHRYATTADGRIRKANILTPTAQNEPWLGELLTSAASGSSGAEVRTGLEQAIHDADPCLPCSTAPMGTMDLVVDTVPAVPSGKGN
jgi:NAD-reducing hydrogenase large subunit